MKTIYDYRGIYEKLDIDPTKLGVVMLDLEPIDVTATLPEYVEYFYGDGDDRLRYAKGPVADTTAHTTLLYGFERKHLPTEWAAEIRVLLEDLDLSSVTVDHVGFFPGQFGLDYSCIVAHLDTKDTDLQEANRRLRFLPHIDTFLEYRPHVTLAYVRKEFTDLAVQVLDTAIGELKLAATGLNLGD